MVNKTRPTVVPVPKFIDAIEHPRKREEATRLDAIFQEITGFQPVMWGASIIGYGAYDYKYPSGRSGRFLATGFSPRKAHHVIYIMPGYRDFGPILDRLGKHKKGKSCLYINKLADIKEPVLVALIQAGLADLAKHWPIHPS